MTHQHEREPSVRWRVLPETADVQAAAVDVICEAAADALSARGVFHIVLAGGDTPRGVYRRLCLIDTDWQAWHVYFGDERCVPRGSADRNDGLIDLDWLNHVAIPAHQIHRIPAELGPQEGARRYATTVAAVDCFDLVLLGFGPDGHTASLFPGDARLVLRRQPPAWAVPDSPKPPPMRVTLSPERLSLSRRVLFLVAGTAKAAAVARWRAGETLPAITIRPPGGVEVLLDSAAAGIQDSEV